MEDQKALEQAREEILGYGIDYFLLTKDLLKKDMMLRIFH
jgi:hypothetical protein